VRVGAHVGVSLGVLDGDVVGDVVGTLRQPFVAVQNYATSCMTANRECRRFGASMQLVAYLRARRLDCTPCPWPTHC